MSLWRRFVEPYVGLPDIPRWRAYLAPVLLMPLPFWALAAVLWSKGGTTKGVLGLIMAILVTALSTWMRWFQIQLAKRVQEERRKQPPRQPGIKPPRKRRRKRR